MIRVVAKIEIYKKSFNLVTDMGTTDYVKSCGVVYCGSCSGNGYGGSCPYCGGNESKSF